MFKIPKLKYASEFRELFRFVRGLPIRTKANDDADVSGQPLDKSNSAFANQ